MPRAISTISVFPVALSLTSSTAKAQWPYVGPYGFGGYGGFDSYGGIGGYGPFGGYGFGPNASFGPWGGLGNGPFNYSQQLGQQQADLTQQIYEQQQQAIIGQVREAQGRLEQLDSIKEQMFQKYLDINDSDKAAVRAGLIRDYLTQRF